jgi:tRNA G10  N-methylase Trm11
MSKQIFFILGRNPKLSYHEIMEFCKARDVVLREVFFESNVLVIEVGEEVVFDIGEFGGTMYIGDVGFVGAVDGVRGFLEGKELVMRDKFSFAVHGNCDSCVLKERFKVERKRAVQKHGRKFLELQDGGKIGNPSADCHILFYEYSGQVYLGLVSQSYDSVSAEKRDMGKPVRREALAISPRLGKILVNLSGAKGYDNLLDPFCGVGVILIEALLKGVNVYGMDKDIEAVRGVRQNLGWLYRNYDVGARYDVKCGDSVRVPCLDYDAVATETPLGQLLTKRPSDMQAKQIVRDFERLIVPILRRLGRCKRSGARIAITFPVVRGYHVDFDKIADATGLRVYLKPILESRRGQYVGRDVLVFV